MEIKTLEMDISEIKPNPKNPRVIKDANFKALVKSISEFPEMLDIREVVCDENMIILGGNKRYEATKTAGVNTIRVKQVFGLSEKQKRESVIKDNQSYGEFDEVMLKELYSEDELLEWYLQTSEEDLAPIQQDDFKAQMDKYTDDNCVYPIVPKLSEKYDCVIIFSKNKLDTNFLEEALGIDNEKCYKCDRIGKSHVVSSEKFIELWNQNKGLGNE